MEIKFILNDTEIGVTPIKAADSIIDFALKNYPTDTDIEFLRQLSEHLEVFLKGSERERYLRMEEDG